jgi:oligopeptide transport system permease protein
MKKLMLAFALTVLVVELLSVFLFSFFLSTSGIEQNVEAILLPPSSSHWFGTDSLGRDLFARVLMGGRVSLVVGLVCSMLTFMMGFVYGAIAGGFEGWVDRVLMRLCDILLSIPSFILVAVLCLSVQVMLPFESSYWISFVSLCVGISATHWMSIARVTRGMVMEIKRRPFVEAAIAIGGSPSHILIRHIAPNMLSTLLVIVAMQIPTNILYESFMSFIGLGMQPPYTSWGLLVKEGWNTLSSFPHLLLYPSAVLFVTVWSFHVVIDNLKPGRR